VSARLLAEVDMKLRDVVRRIGTMKADQQGRDRAFGGINVLFAGDFWQLEPPDGGFLAAIPTEYIKRARQFHPAATVSHGQSLFWAREDGCVQGVTELTECVRCEDEWLLEVQAEFRNGCLSENNHKFLHNKPTTVPGSWVNGKATCGNETFQKLAGSETKSICSKECATCKQDRASRARVAKDSMDEQFRSEKFINAPAIFANNDIKYDVNKRRAREFASTVRQGITWSQAKDTPTHDALRERPDCSRQEAMVVEAR